MFRYETVVRMQHTDAAGVMFFAGVFLLAHNCYEAFMEQREMSLGAMLDEGRYIAPIVHAEADIRKPMRLSEKISITMKLARTGNSSFELAFELINARGEPTAQAATVHAVVDRTTGKCTRIPDTLLAVLKGI
jgi:1,4-dihydroxy-2-naphthoyl-CoA hydrolase